MLSRRQLLASALPATVAASAAASSERTNPTHVLVLPSDPNAVASESALGYQSVLRTMQPSFVISDELPTTSFRHIILPGMRAFSFAFANRLRKLAAGGSWLTFESALCFASEREIQIQGQMLADVFRLQIETPRAAAIGVRSARSYVHYHWPFDALVPDFSEFTPVRGSDAEAIATIRGNVVAVRRRIQRGGIVFLGSPLGPGLFARDREAAELAARLISV